MRHAFDSQKPCLSCRNPFGPKWDSLVPQKLPKQCLMAPAFAQKELMTSHSSLQMCSSHLLSINATVSMSEITANDCIDCWNKVHELISSSFSSLHFSHWKVATWDQWLSEAHALSIETACSKGFSCKCWQQGLSAMPEKKAGVIKVDKSWAVLLMEADFNFANKLIFGSRMMREVAALGEIPDELFSSIQN